MELFIIFGFIVLLALGIPLYIFLFALSSYLFFKADIPILSTVVSFEKLQSQEFVAAIPLFTFAGYLLSHSQSPARIVKVTKNCFSFIPASSSVVVIILMALFTALTGASGVSILALGGLMFPVLKESSKEEPFAHGLITASGSIGLLFAPSLPVIIYAIIANQNLKLGQQIEIDTLFRVAIIPSLILITSFIIYGFFKEKKVSLYFDFKKTKAAIWEGKWEIPLPFLVYGGIYSGWFTVMEAGIVTALYTFTIVFLINRDLSLKNDFVLNVVDSLKLSGNIFIIMATAFILTNYLVYESIPDKIFTFISPYLQNKITFLLAVNIILLVTGCLLDIFSAILIVLPLLIPIVERYGIDPYHFAIIFLVNLEIGYITPPVGLNLFISSYRFKKSILYLYRSTVPFLILMLVQLAIFTYIPSLTTFLKPRTSQTENQTTIDRIAPNRINQISIVKKTDQSITLKFLPSQDGEKQATKYSVYYLDEEETDLTILKDFADFKEFSSEDIPQEGDHLYLTLPELTANNTYSLVLIAYDEQNNESIPSEIITFSLP